MRTLFIVVTLGAFAACWGGRQLHMHQKEEAAVRELSRFGCVCRWDVPCDACPRWLRASLRRVAFFRRVTYLSIGGNVQGSDDEFTDADAAKLDAFEHLKTLLLTTPRLTDAGAVRACRNHTCLAALGFFDAEITDEVIGELGVHPRLETLWLCTGTISGKSIPELAAYPCLGKLDLDGTGVTDGVLPLLCSIPQLREVSLRDTDVSIEGAERFQREHPNIEVIGSSGLPRDALDLDE